MKHEDCIKKACQVLRKRVRFDGAGLRLPTTEFPNDDTPAIKEATPRPWNVDANGNIWASDTKIVDMSKQPSQSAQYRGKSDAEHDANRALIVKCVNQFAAFEALLEACRRGITRLESGPQTGYNEETVRLMSAAIALAETTL